MERKKREIDEGRAHFAEHDLIEAEDECDCHGKRKRINLLIKDIQRSPYDGIGKPEPLKENLRGMWSRPIDEANRIVYCEKYGGIIIVACRGHYND